MAYHTLYAKMSDSHGMGHNILDERKYMKKLLSKEKNDAIIYASQYANQHVLCDSNNTTFLDEELKRIDAMNANKINLTDIANLAYIALHSQSPYNKQAETKFNVICNFLHLKENQKKKILLI